jgi:hypothetical protein
LPAARGGGHFAANLNTDAARPDEERVDCADENARDIDVAGGECRGQVGRITQRPVSFDNVLSA